MQDDYDYIILGTGIAECVMCWAHVSKGKRVVQVDRNATYGSATRTLRYSEIEVQFSQYEEDRELKSLDNYFCIDLVPKLMLADGEVREFLGLMGIFDVVDFVSIPGSFIYKGKKVHTVPASEKDAMRSGIIGLFQKPKVVRFFWDVNKYCKMSEKQKQAHPLPKTMREYFDRYGIGTDAREFIGHAVALNLDDEYLGRDPRETLNKIELFARSILAFGEGTKSPYVYPLYGSSEISQAFSRKAAINGAIFRLNTPILDIKRDGEMFIVVIEDQTEGKQRVLRAKHLLGEPTYFPEMVAECRRIVHCTCIIRDDDAAICKDIPSAQVIFLASELGRKNDIFLLILGERECSAPKGFKVAMISTVMEGCDPESEVSFVVSKLGNVVRKYVSTRPIYAQSSRFENVSVSETVDHSTHFESLYLDILRLAEETGVADLFAKKDVPLQNRNRL